MKPRRVIFWLLVLVLLLSLAILNLPAGAQDPPLSSIIVGSVIDRQQQPVSQAVISLLAGDGTESLAQDQTLSDGSFVLELDPQYLRNNAKQQFSLHVERPHFQSQTVVLSEVQVQQIIYEQVLQSEDITLVRRASPAFWLATVIFIGVLVLIATGRLHNTLAALVGASLLFAISYLGHPFNKDLFIFEFSSALGYVDWNVIFLIMGMMIIIAVVERTGIFQWLAFMAYRISGGRTWLLLVILMVITGVASAFLDNVTTMLLMTPITVQIALSLGISPLALLIPEVMASNVVGISTLIGTPTNILIGSYANISFTDFLVNLTPGVILALIGLTIYCLLLYRKELIPQFDGDEEEEDDYGGVSQLLLKKLAEQAHISEPTNLKKAGWIGLGMLFLFILGERVHLIPSVTALMGATALLVWIRPNIEEMIEAVDWTTLVFFISLFICVGGIQEVGLISFIAEFIARLVGDNLLLAMLSVIWLSAILSTVVANIPFTAAMLPVIGFLTLTIPGAQSKVLFYCLSIGSAMGGNGSLIGASANMVTSGIAERAGYPITYVYFLKKGFPALLITVGIATLWVVYRFVIQ